MLQAVVEVEFTRLETLPDLAVQPELVAVSVQAGWFTVGVEGQQVRPQAFRKCRRGPLVEWPLRQPLLLGKNTFGPRPARQAMDCLDWSRRGRAQRTVDEDGGACGRPARPPPATARPACSPASRSYAAPWFAAYREA